MAQANAESEVFVIELSESDESDPIKSMMMTGLGWLFSFLVHLSLLGVLAASVVPTEPKVDGFSLSMVTDEKQTDEGLTHLDWVSIEETEVDIPIISDDEPLVMEVEETPSFDIPDLAAGLELPSSFFGTYVHGERIAFVIDRSSSMRGEKFDQARDEVVAAISKLESSQWFYVVFFDREILQMFGENDVVKDMIPATPTNIERFIEWVSQVDVGRGTMPYRAVRLALRMEPDTLFLLTDGSFNAGDKTVEYFGKSRLRGVSVNTIGFHHQDDGTLEQIAQNHSGTFKFVAGDDR